ncbi:unnamed protein product (macronuclear) [Paramecium tetraurelia]|uniref:SET domain-containing protein n=1 Tax=Paramecium tetraurelia TaxID=5888 RepID=A0D7N3_PARTE|nr:uncharacterized protein GSPATT00014017001 [Paramecium tetraurelia]CAK79050.1 unnamed protein product [Paramecium tetraurelia]|eukprot:XP_001446447.1 hypothetical protein (macronuclear) [Paramecium tetraurelia strain d4-2]
MIYFQQSCLEEKKQDMPKNQASLQSPKQLEDTLERIKEFREEFMASLQEYLTIRLSNDDQDPCEEVIQIIKNLCIKLVDKPLWNFKELAAELELQLEGHIDDYTVFNQVKQLISSLNAQYSNKFNQISSCYLKSIQSEKAIPKQQIKRICHYDEVQELIPNTRDRVEEINQHLLSFIHHDSLLQVDPWCCPFQSSFGVTLTDQDISYQAKKLNVDIILIDTFGINCFFCSQIMRQFYPSCHHRSISTKGIYSKQCRIYFGQALSNIYDVSNILVDWPNILTLKGKGVVCCNFDGFVTNEFINFYFGEVYTPQRWFEKQTVFNKRMQDGNRKSGFQSPYAEFHINDELLFIDPTRYGNIALHISYSCDPNCKFVTVQINSSYQLAIFTLKKINYLEELTLPFPSTSNDLCLCGSIYCKRLSQLEAFNNRLTQNYPNYIQRNALLLQSTIFGKINNQTTIPDWLSNWEKLNSAQDQINILTCVDKVKFVLNTLNVTTPPLYLVFDTFDVFWKNYDNNKPKNELKQSIFNEVKTMLMRHSDRKECQEGLEILQLMKSIIESKDQYKMQLTRLLLLVLSELLLKMESAPFHNEGLSTILYFMSFTHTYFSSTQYEGFNGKPFEENEFEYIPQPKNKQKLALSKMYTPQYIWGQLINWNKQTLQNPQSSMAQERRGVLCYPSLILSFDNKHKLFPYQCKTREKFLEYFYTKSDIQPDLSIWSYKNQYNVYGTIFFEQCFSQQIVGEQFITEISKCGLGSFLNKFKFWLQIESRFKQDNQMIEYLNFIYEKYFVNINNQLRKFNSNSECTEQVAKKIKQNNHSTIIDETQQGQF